LLKNVRSQEKLLQATAGDDRVREAHEKLNGMIYKADNKVWDTIYPPNGWNCRCEVIAHA
jgi:SPP1 gp7 family putative phage head morphogenesis protein